MPFNCRFAIASDLHIALPHTVWDSPYRFHRVEISIPVLDYVLERLSQMELDFLLLPGDLTQHGEPENHRWLVDRLAQLPYPTYVVPGNHDVPKRIADASGVGLADFPRYYQPFGYSDPERLYYTHQLLPGLRLIGLNSNQFDSDDNQIGCLDDEQLQWLQQVLAEYQQDLILVMVHHNVVEHLPDQANHPIGRRYILDNASTLRSLLQKAGVQLIFTGHLHIQDIACDRGLYDITTGSLVSYPHPYRLLHLRTDDQGNSWLQIESERVDAVPGWDDLQRTSRDFLAQRSHPFMVQLLTQAPVNLSHAAANPLAPSMRYFWVNVAEGDALFDFDQFPADVRRYFQRFGAIAPEGHLNLIDNHISLLLGQ